jgi:hypothetical protein
VFSNTVYQGAVILSTIFYFFGLPYYRKVAPSRKKTVITNVIGNKQMVSVQRLMDLIAIYAVRRVPRLHRICLDTTLEVLVMMKNKTIHYP